MAKCKRKNKAYTVTWMYYISPSLKLYLMKVFLDQLKISL